SDDLSSNEDGIQRIEDSRKTRRAIPIIHHPSSILAGRTFMALRIPRPLAARFRAVKLFLCDVDGVLTDGAVWMGGGVESKRFNIRDGLGLKFLQQHGIKVGWVSRRPSSATQQRADDLKIDFVAQHDGGKIPAVESILRRTGLNWDTVCYVGDDVVDI